MAAYNVVMRKLWMFAALMLGVSAASAGPVITSISPASGPVAGGTVVTLKGSGFSNVCIICSPPFFADPRVFFGGTEAAKVRFIDSTTVEATTPPHLPITVAITIHQIDGSVPFIFTSGFTFEGDPESGFEPVLFPLLSAPVFGLFGSEFHTTARIADYGSQGGTMVYGQDLVCTLFDPPRGPYDPIALLSNGPDANISSYCSPVQGRIVWIRKGDHLAANLRVNDVSRNASSHGTEIPVVHPSEFRADKIILLGVPTDARFRSTLRIYSLAQTDAIVNLSINGVGRQVHLQPGTNIFEPSMVMIGDFPRPADVNPIQFQDRVEILPSSVPLWAFVSVTNNVTQEITTITPQ